MKQTTKPNTKQSHLKRDLAGNVAALPLPTPPGSGRGEGGWPAAAKFETRAAGGASVPASRACVNEQAAGGASVLPHAGSTASRLGSEICGLHQSARGDARPIVDWQFELSPIDLQFPQFAGIAVRRDQPLSLSFVTNHRSPITSHQSPITNHQSPITNHQSPITNHQSPITNHQSPITNLQTYDLIRVAAV